MLPQPSVGVNRVEELVKQFLRGAVAQLLARPSVQLISSRQDVLWREEFNGGALGHEGSEQPIVTLVYTVGSFAVGTVSYYVLERPINHGVKKLLEK